MAGRNRKTQQALKWRNIREPFCDPALYCPGYIAGTAISHSCFLSPHRRSAIRRRVICERRTTFTGRKSLLS